ncbi:MAG: TlpA disulfide reductase family protein [Opitutaceae bacterium]|nr:TlpA disulfide reductase family protein [Opitutaceae bacterium]
MSSLRHILKGLLIVCFVGASSMRGDLSVGQEFPSLQGVEGLPGDFQLKGQVTLIDFCASWCSPCKQSFPVLNDLHREFSSRGVRVMGVSVDTRSTDFESLKTKWKPEFPVYHDARQELVGRVKVPTMPTSYLVDRDGIVRAVHVGFRRETAARLRSDILALLSP